MARKRHRDHVYVETDGQVYLVKDHGKLRFPRDDERLPFPTTDNGRMDFGADQVVKRKPVLTHHPEEWLGRDAIFERADVDPLVKRAIYTSMVRCVSEVILANGPRVLMVKAVRGYSKGHWNVPGGFMDYGEGPEVGVEREAEEEIGVDIVLDRLLGVYVSGFPGKPAYTLGFVYQGRVTSEAFRLKADEIEAARWFTVDRALTLTRNPFAKWGLVEFFLQSPEARRAMRVKRHGIRASETPHGGPIVFLDRDGVINRGRPGYVRKPDDFEFLPGAIDGMRRLQEHGWRLVVVTNQDVAGWKLVPERQLARIHDRMLGSLRKEGVEIAEIYYCPHHVLSDCACRKPRPGMLLAAARDFGVRPRQAWIVGDKPLDLEAGWAFGCRSAWVGSKAWRARFAADARRWSPDVIAADLWGAAKAIIGRPVEEDPREVHERLRAIGRRDRGSGHKATDVSRFQE